MRDSQILDLITSTLHKMGKGKFTQIAQELHEYEVMGKLLTKNGGVQVIPDGMGLKEYLMTKRGGSFRWVDLFEPDSVNLVDVMAEMKVEWCHGTANMMYERRELLMNRGESRINNVFKPRRAGMMLDVADGLEGAFWDAPVAGNDKVPWGIQYWIVRNASEGFNGGAPSGFTTVGNVNLTKHPAFKNYTNTYSAVSKDDLIKKLRKAHWQTRWKSPINMAEFQSETGQKRKLYCGYELLSDLEDIGEAQNDNLGRDLAPYDGQMTFRRHPIVPVDKLCYANDTAYPIYMIDTSTFKLFVLKGDYLRESDAEKAPNQHNVYVVHVDLSYQTMCLNRRANAVLYKS
ncbi:MAG TPA: phage major capsid protein [Anaerohalosphaeraceae bacterium]|nr:phage major capsid protein [Anaerohalosphaeraceae bacterium]